MMMKLMMMMMKTTAAAKPRSVHALNDGDGEFVQRRFDAFVDASLFLRRRALLTFPPHARIVLLNRSASSTLTLFSRGSKTWATE